MDSLDQLDDWSALDWTTLAFHDKRLEATFEHEWSSSLTRTWDAATSMFSLGVFLGFLAKSVESSLGFASVSSLLLRLFPGATLLILTRDQYVKYRTPTMLIARIGQIVAYFVRHPPFAAGNCAAIKAAAVDGVLTGVLTYPTWFVVKLQHHLWLQVLCLAITATMLLREGGLCSALAAGGECACPGLYRTLRSYISYTSLLHGLDKAPALAAPGVGPSSCKADVIPTKADALLAAMDVVAHNGSCSAGDPTAAAAVATMAAYDACAVAVLACALSCAVLLTLVLYLVEFDARCSFLERRGVLQMPLRGFMLLRMINAVVTFILALLWLSRILMLIFSEAIMLM